MLDIDSVAEELGRTVGAVWGQIMRSGMANSGAQLRSCLPCAGIGRRRMFFSISVGKPHLLRLRSQRNNEVRVMPDENKHWTRICRTFGFRDCRDAGAARAAEWLGVDRDMLRATYDMRLRTAAVHALDERLLEYADTEIDRLEKELAAAKARRHQQWLAERSSDMHARSTCTASWTEPSTGDRKTYHLLPHEEILRDLLNEECV